MVVVVVILSNVSLCGCFLTDRVPVPYIALIDGVTMGGVSINFLFLS